MNGSNELVETLLQQGKNVIACMKDLKRISHKKGNDRLHLCEKFSANQHSFNVYTYINSEVKDSKVIQTFKTKLELFNAEFDRARFDLEGDVDKNRVETLYVEVLTAYNEMVKALGYENQMINIKRF